MNNGGRLQGKTAIITGAGTGIGEAIADKFAQEGADILLVGLPDDPLEDVANTIHDRFRGARAAIYKGDISREDEAAKAVACCIGKFRKLDILVNNAGVFLYTGETEDYPTDKFEETVRTNIGSVFHMTKAALPWLMKTRGNIVSAGSESGKIGLENNAVFGGTKGFVHAFMRGVAIEYGRHGVRANCVCPGPVDTAMTHKETGPMTDEMEVHLTASTVFGRRGTVEEIANVYAFLASDEASYVTGALWLVDGATTILKGSVGEKAGRAARMQPEVTLPVHHTHEGMAHKNYEKH
jgi:NAD(P)-dependent dehydrogenase (short-subunit alcohol dehydrogenase family)